ncbi:MAG: hypothetical protein ACE362_26305 [Phaeodactylibacter xiamenensis]|uniref:hypothetical protein n=1 Tax=Phaeodactylibacter xiamenensis TaxID=1524460 RepID=UPI00136377F4|nr:hypothetical protein [Phaeodactylibacter xiamenensis]MCR9051925.1 hypothetical protein [bacterium]
MKIELNDLDPIERFSYKVVAQGGGEIPVEIMMISENTKRLSLLSGKKGFTICITMLEK